VLGVATGGCIVLFLLFVVHMFFAGSPLAQAAERSYSRRLSAQAIDLLGERVPDELRAVFDLPALHEPSLLPSFTAWGRRRTVRAEKHPWNLIRFAPA
jgi:hypothetical protein